jgi:hypothetical protein
MAKSCVRARPSHNQSLSPLQNLLHPQSSLTTIAPASNGVDIASPDLIKAGVAQ